MIIHFGLATPLIQTSHYATIMRKKPVVFQTHYVLNSWLIILKEKLEKSWKPPLNSLPEVIWLDLVWFIAAVVGISLALHIARSFFVKRCSWKTGQCARLHFTLKHVNHGIEWIWQLNSQWKLNLTTRIKLTAYATFEIARQTACVRVTNACLWASLSGELPCGSSWQNSMEDLRISD